MSESNGFEKDHSLTNFSFYVDVILIPVYLIMIFGNLALSLRSLKNPVMRNVYNVLIVTTAEICLIIRVFCFCYSLKHGNPNLEPDDL